MIMLWTLKFWRGRFKNNTLTEFNIINHFIWRNSSFRNYLIFYFDYHVSFCLNHSDILIIINYRSCFFYSLKLNTRTSTIHPLMNLFLQLFKVFHICILGCASRIINFFRTYTQCSLYIWYSMWCYWRYIKYWYFVFRLCALPKRWSWRWSFWWKTTASGNQLLKWH